MIERQRRWDASNREPRDIRYSRSQPGVEQRGLGFQQTSRPIKEREFQKTVIDLAEILGWAVYHVANVRTQLRSRTAVGFPDLVLVRERVIFAELKSDKGKTSAHQDRWLERLGEAGATAVVWRPKDWPQIERTLRRRTSGKNP